MKSFHFKKIPTANISISKDQSGWVKTWIDITNKSGEKKTHVVTHTTKKTHVVTRIGLTRTLNTHTRIDLQFYDTKTNINSFEEFCYVNNFFLRFSNVFTMKSVSFTFYNFIIIIITIPWCESFHIKESPLSVDWNSCSMKLLYYYLLCRLKDVLF